LVEDVTDADTVIAIAKAAGFVISAEKLNRAQAEVSDEEVKGVHEPATIRRPPCS